MDTSRGKTILIVEDVEETRCLIEVMLKNNGYNVAVARDEDEAVTRACYTPPDLIVMSLGLIVEQLVDTAKRIRERACLAPEVAVVIFCVPTIPEGAEIEVLSKVYVTRPDNFDQLRVLFHRLLHRTAANC